MTINLVKKLNDHQWQKIEVAVRRQLNDRPYQVCSHNVDMDTYLNTKITVEVVCQEIIGFLYSQIIAYEFK